jgi:hypothetical protein
MLRRPADKVHIFLEYQAHFEFSQRRQTEWIDIQSVKLFLSEP